MAQSMVRKRRPISKALIYLYEDAVTRGVWSGRGGRRFSPTERSWREGLHDDQAPLFRGSADRPEIRLAVAADRHRGDQKLRGRVRPATLPSRRQGAPFGVCRVGGKRLAHRGRLDAAVPFE